VVADLNVDLGWCPTARAGDRPATAPGAHRAARCGPRTASGAPTGPSSFPTTTVGRTAPIRQSPVTDSPASWGTLVSGHASHAVATYARNLGGGQMVVTFVVWAR